MNPKYIGMVLSNIGYRKILLISVIAGLTMVSPVLTYTLVVNSFNQIDEKAYWADEEKHRLELQDKLTNPKTGTTPELISNLVIGMTGEETQETLQYPYSLGIEIFPYNYAYNGMNWVSNEIPIRGVGYIQTVFIERQLVGLGSLNPNDGRVCGGCLEDMLRGERPRLKGLPYHVDGKCPECGSENVVPFGAQFAKYNNQKNVCCDINVPTFTIY